MSGVLIWGETASYVERKRIPYLVADINPNIRHRTKACTTWGTISSAASHGRPKDWGDDTSPVNAAIPTTPVHLGCPNKWILSTQEERVRLCNTNHGNDWCETARCPYLTELHAIKVFCE